MTLCMSFGLTKYVNEGVLDLPHQSRLVTTELVSVKLC